VPPECLIDEHPLWFPVPAQGFGIDLPNPEEEPPGPGPFLSFASPSAPRPPGLSRRWLQALPGAPGPARARSRPSQTPPSPGPREFLTQDRWGALGNRAIANRRSAVRRTAKSSDLPHYGGGGIIAAGQLPDSTRTGLIVSLVDSQCARPCHRTQGRQAFASCLGLAELSRGHCTPYI
jgi:hypothetical protein